MPATIYNAQVVVTSDTSKAKAGVKDLDKDIQKAGSQKTVNPFDKVESGSKSAINQTRLLQNELRSLVGNIPLVGTAFNSVGADVLKFFNNNTAAIKRLESNLQRLEERALSTQQKFQNRLSDFSKGLSIKYDDRVDTDFLKKFGSLTDKADKNEMLMSVGLSSASTAELDRAALQFQKLERDGALALTSIEGKAVTTREKLATLRAETDGMSEATAGFSTRALALTTVLLVVLAVVGMLGFKAAATGDEIYKVAQKTSFSTETLSVLRVQAQEAGNSFNEFSSALPRFEKNLGTAADGNKKLAATFKELGVSFGAGTSAEESFKQFLTGFSQIQDESKRAEIAIQLFGKSGANLIPTFARMGASFDEAEAHARALGLVMGRDAVNASHNFEVRIRDLKLGLEGLMLTIGNAALPIISTLINVVLRLAPGILVVAGAFALWKTLALAGAAVNHLLSMSFAEITLAGKSFFAWLTTSTGGIGLLIIAIGSLVSIFHNLLTAEREVTIVSKDSIETVQKSIAERQREIAALEKEAAAANTNGNAIDNERQHREALLGIKRQELAADQALAKAQELAEVLALINALKNLRDAKKELLEASTPKLAPAGTGPEGQVVMREIPIDQARLDAANQAFEKQDTLVRQATESLKFHRDVAKTSTDSLIGLASAYEKDNEIVGQFTGRLNTNSGALGNAANKAEDLATQLSAVRSEMAALSQPSDLRIEQTILMIAKHAKDKSDAIRLVKDILKDDPDLRQAVNENRRIKETTEGARSVLQPSDRHRHRGSGAADQAARYDMREAELDLKAAERLYKEATAAAQREYELRDISLGDFVRRQIDAENKLLGAKIAALQTERDAANRLSKSSEREYRLKEIAEKEAQIYSDGAEKFQQIRDNAAKIELNSLLAQREQTLAIIEAYNKRDADMLRAAGQAGLMSREEVEQELYELEWQAHQQRVELLNDDLVRAGENVDEQIRIRLELKKADADYAVSYQEIMRRIAEARKQDLADARANAKQLRDLQYENLQIAEQTRRSRIEEAQRIGALSPRAAKRQIAALDIDTENYSYRQQQADLIAQHAAIDVTRLSAEQRAQIDAAFRTREELLEVQHQDKLNEIRLRPLEEYKAKVESLARSIANVFGSAFDSLFEHGKSFWKEMEDGFKNLFKQIVKDAIESKVKETIESILLPRAQSNGALAHGSSNSGGSIFDRVKSFFNLGGGNGNAALTPPFAGGSIPGVGGGSQAGGIGGVISNFKQNGFIGGLKNLLGFGSSAAPAAAGAVGMAGAADPFFGLGAPPAMGAAGGSAAGGASSGGLFAHLGFLANPWMIAGIGAAIGGFFLFKHLFGHDKTLDHLKSAIQSTYSVDVRDKEVLKQIKQVGQQGYGNVDQHIQDVIAYEPVKEIIEQYAEQTGQTNSKLVTDKQLSDPGFAANNFIRRLVGGAVPGANMGRDYVPALLDGGEYVLNAQATNAIGVDALDDLNSGRAVVVPAPQVKREGGGPVPPSSGGGSTGGGIPPSMIAALIGAITRNSEVLDDFEAEDENSLFRRMVSNNSRAVVDAVDDGLQQGYRKPQVQRNLGLS